MYSFIYLSLSDFCFLLSTNNNIRRLRANVGGTKIVRTLMLLKTEVKQNTLMHQLVPVTPHAFNYSNVRT